MSDSIGQYVKGCGGRKNQRVGYLLALKGIGGQVIITGSKVNTTLGDVFDRDEAKAIAWDRQRTVRKGRNNMLPRSFGKDLEIFYDRCRRYFGTDNIIIPKYKVIEKIEAIEKEDGCDSCGGNCCVSKNN